MTHLRRDKEQSPSNSINTDSSVGDGGAAVVEQPNPNMASREGGDCGREQRQRASTTFGPSFLLSSAATASFSVSDVSQGVLSLPQTSCPLNQSRRRISRWGKDYRPAKNTKSSGGTLFGFPLAVLFLVDQGSDFVIPSSFSFVSSRLF